MNDDRPIPEWLHPAVERVGWRGGGYDIPSSALALAFKRRPTKEMKANAAKKGTTK